MGNILKRKIARFKFYKEIFKCNYDEDQMNIQDFEAEVNALVHNSQVRVGALLCKAVFVDNVIVAYPDIESSNENKLVFYNLFDEDERYMLTDDGLSSLSSNSSLDVDKINTERKMEIDRVLEFYHSVYRLIGKMRRIPLTDILSFDYSFATGCYYGIRDQFGHVTEIREIDDETQRLPDADNKIYLNRGFPIATVDYRHMDEIVEIKRELDELWEKLSKDENKSENKNISLK